MRFPTLQKCWKSVNIWRSYRDFKGGNIFCETQCIESNEPMDLRCSYNFYLECRNNVNWMQQLACRCWCKELLCLRGCSNWFWCADLIVIAVVEDVIYRPGTAVGPVVVLSVSVTFPGVLVFAERIRIVYSVSCGSCGRDRVSHNDNANDNSDDDSSNGQSDWCLTESSCLSRVWPRSTARHHYTHIT